VRLGSAEAAPWQISVLRHLLEVADAVAVIDRPAQAIDGLAWPPALPAADQGHEEALRQLDPDFALDLGDEAPDACLRQRPRHGCRVIRDDAASPPSRVGHYALRQGKRMVVLRLLQLAAGGDEGALLQEIAVKAVRHSPQATRARALADFAREPARVAARIGRGAPPRVGEERWCAARERPPGARSVSLPARLRNLIARILEEGYEDQWTIGLIDAPVRDLIGRFDPRRIRWLAEVQGGYLADPMVAPADRASGSTELIVLAEAYWFAEPRGRIVALQLQRDRRLGAVREVLPLPYHASYPQLIEHQDRLYCLPEVSAGGRI
jgi:hypothetical protein